ncbi:MAG: PD-(D/E)XK nuclease family protein [Pseudomonadota bacterium]
MSAVLQLLRAQGTELHTSASAIRCLQECPRQYWLRYVEGRPPQDRSARMVLGSAIHKALALFYRCLRDGDPEPDHQTLLGVAAASITTEAMGDPAIAYKEGADSAALIAEASGLLHAFLDQGFRPRRVLAVEEPFSLDLSDPTTGEVMGYEERVVGAMDLVALQDDGALIVVDHKLCSRKDTAKAERADVQMGLYAWAAQQVWGREPALLYQDLVSTKQAKVVIQEVARQPGDVEEVLESVASALELIHVAVDHPAGKKLMARRRSWMCAGCGWRQACG